MLGANMDLVVNDGDDVDDAFRPLLILISGLTSPSARPLSVSSLRQPIIATYVNQGHCFVACLLAEITAELCHYLLLLFF